MQRVLANKAWFWGRRGIRRRLLVTGLVFLALMLLANTLAGTLYTRAQIKRAQARVQTEVARRVAFEIEEFIQRKLLRLSDLATTASLHPIGSEEQRLLSLLLLKNDASFTQISVLDDAGIEVLKASEREVYPPGRLSDRSGSPIYAAAIAGKSFIGPVYSSDKAEPYVTLAVPIRTRPDVAAGALIGELNLKFLWEIIGTIRFGKAGYAYLVDARGNLIAHADPSLVLKRDELGHLYGVSKFLSRGGGSDPTPAGEGVGLGGKSVLSTFTPVRGLGGAVVLEEPVEEALSDLRRLGRDAGLLLAAGLLVGAVVIVWVSNQITKPIDELHKGTEIIAAGNLDHRVKVRTDDEIGELGRQLNRMAAELKSSYATLEQKVEHRTRDFVALHDVTSSVNRSLEVDAVLQEVIKKITEIFQFDSTRVFLYDRERDELRLRASHDRFPGLFEDMGVFRRGQGITGTVAESGEPLIFEDAQGDSRYEELSQSKKLLAVGFRFYAAFPIRAKERLAGTLLCIGQASRRLLPDEVRLITSMTEQVGVAVEKTALFRDMSLKAKELSALYDLTTTVSRSLEIEEVLQEVIKKITDLFRFDVTRVFLYDERKRILRLRASFVVDATIWAPFHSFRRGQGIVGRVADAGEAIVIEDVRADPRYERLSYSKATQRASLSFLAVLPIKAKDNCLGTMVCQGRAPRRLDPDEVRVLTSMTEQIGLAMEKASLFEQVRRKSRELEALVEINKGIAALLDREVLLPRIAEEARKLINVERATFRLIRDGKLVLVAESCTGESVPLPSLPLGESLSGKVVAENRVVVVQDMAVDPVIAEEMREIMCRAGYRSYMGFPLRVGQRVIGTINFTSKSERDLAPEEVNLITAFVDQAAIAIQNASLFAEVKEKSLELEKANRDLIETSRAKSEFMAAMSHELRTPLNVVLGNASLMRDGFFGALSEKQQGAVDKVLRYSRILLKLIGDVLALTRLEAKKMSIDVSTFRVEEIVDQIRNYAEQLNFNGHLNVVWNVARGLPALTTDALKLEEIFQNLIGNAFKFTPEGKIEISIRDLPNQERVEFSVADTGVGIEPEALDKIFEQFYQHREAHTGNYSGVGLGLSIVKKYLEMMHGEIRVVSEPRKGSTFTFTLPYSI